MTETYIAADYPNVVGLEMPNVVDPIGSDWSPDLCPAYTAPTPEELWWDLYVQTILQTEERIMKLERRMAQPKLDRRPGRGQISPLGAAMEEMKRRDDGAWYGVRVYSTENGARVAMSRTRKLTRGIPRGTWMMYLDRETITAGDKTVSDLWIMCIRFVSDHWSTQWIRPDGKPDQRDDSLNV